MNGLRFTPVFALLMACALCSCSKGKKKQESDATNSGLLKALNTQPVLNDDTIERLKEIANAPTSQLDPDTTSAEEEADNPESIATVDTEEATVVAQTPPTPSTPEPEPVSTANLIAEWQKNGLNPLSIEIGDIFSDHSGPILNKAASLADRLDLEDWTRTVNSVTKQETSRVPVTLSVAEIDKLKSTAPLGTDLPSRSVAIDFRTISQTANEDQLEQLYQNIEQSSDTLAIQDEKTLAKVAAELAQVKARLKKGETLYVITGRVSSNEMRASYPGGLLGKRDTALIGNAISALYPHLDNLTAVQDAQRVRITRDPSIYWEFDIRQLILQDDQIKIAPNTLAEI